MTANEQIAEDTIARTIYLSRYSAGLRKDVIKLLNQVEKDLIAALPSVTTQVRKDRLNKMLAESRALIKDGYAEVSALTSSELATLSVDEAEWQKLTINDAITVEIMAAMPTEAALVAMTKDTLVQGAVNADWWARQGANLQFQYTNAVRTGMAQSETIGQISKRVQQVMDVSRRDATSLVRTSVQTVAIESRDMTMQKNSAVIKGKVSIATLDGRTTPVCMAYSGATYMLENEPLAPNKLPYIAIPRHWSCRSVWSSITKSWKELGLDLEEFTPSTRSSIDGQVPASTTFDEFLTKKGEAWQDAQLGKGRAELWRKGKITLSDLVDGNGRELTLAELRALR